MPMQSLLYNVLVLLTFVDVPIWMKTKSIFQKLIAMKGEFPLSRPGKEPVAVSASSLAMPS